MTDDLKAEKKAQKAADARLAWAEHLAEQDAINKNMARLRAERLAREAAEASQPAPGSKKSKTKR